MVSARGAKSMREVYICIFCSVKNFIFDIFKKKKKNTAVSKGPKVDWLCTPYMSSADRCELIY